jgi:tetratricopeptide (TPR) repeat protein
MSPEGRKERIIEAVKRITLKVSEIRPLILATEDLHWIDKSSEEYLRHLLDSISGARVFLIFTYRPEFVHTWGAKSYHSQVNLNRLSNRESLAMVSHLLGTEEIDRELEKLILEKTEGVPFFIEEFIKSLKDLKIIERKKTAYHMAKDLQEVTIPSTIQDVIMARVDSLPDGAKELLQMGSVIEREFRYELIKQVSELPEKELLSRLSVLKDAEVIFERGIYPESTYIFKHALIQEVVYDLMLTRRKKQLHNKIGLTIEQLYKDNLHDYYGVLAEHFINSEGFENAANYCRLAGKKAEKAGSINDAISYGEKQVVCLEKLSLSDHLEKNLIDARTILGLYYIQLSQHAKAKETVNPIVNLAEKGKYNRRFCQILCTLGSYYSFVEEDIPKALEYSEKARKVGQEINDLISLVLAHTEIGACLYHNCEFEKALTHWEKSLEINVMANSLWGISTIKSYIAILYVTWGKINLGYKTSSEALRIADESGDIFSKAHAHHAHGFSCYVKGYLKEAEQNLLKAADFCERINVTAFAAFSYALLGDIYLDMEEHRKSQENFERAIFLSQNIRTLPSQTNLSKISLAKAKVMNHAKDINLNGLFKYYEDNKLKYLEGLMSAGICAILLNIDDQRVTEAEKWVKKAIEVDTRNGMMWCLARDYALYSDLFKRKGNLPKAKENLSKAIEIFRECGADGWVKKYEKELATLG